MRFGVAAALAERVLEALPMTRGRGRSTSRRVLGHVSPALHRALGEPALAELSPLERTRKLGAALVALFERREPRPARLVIAVDDVHRADGESLGVLARLALRTERARGCCS